MPGVNYDLIVLAREAVGITQAELAQLLQMDQSTISKIEHGLSVPPPSFILKLVDALGFPAPFFEQEWKPIRVEGHYRRKLSLSAKTLKECKAKMTIVEKHLAILLDSIDLATQNIPKWDVEKDGSPILCANYVREFWKLPSGRIENLTKIMEDNGIIIAEMDFPEMEGFSSYSKDGIPIVFANINRSGDRDLLTKAHELFHIIAHFGQKISAERDIDKEAMEFASEFLVPAKNVQQDLVKLNIGKLADLKRYWRVSMQSLLVKAKRLGCITQDQYEYLWKQMGIAGYRVKEPVETKKESATLLQEILSTYFEEFAYTKQEMELVLNFTSERIEEWYYNKKPNRLKVIRKSA